MKYYTKFFLNGTGITLDVRVEQEMCQISEKSWKDKLDRGTVIAMWVKSSYTFFLDYNFFDFQIYLSFTSADNRSINFVWVPEKWWN